jgi:hypothetical protein
MTRRIAAVLAILAVVLGVGWKLAAHQETAAALQDVSLQQRSEHSQPGPASALAGIRIRLSGSDLGRLVRASDVRAPQISLAVD